jgi:hypothetical protein
VNRPFPALLIPEEFRRIVWLSSLVSTSSSIPMNFGFVLAKAALVIAIVPLFAVSAEVIYDNLVTPQKNSVGSPIYTIQPGEFGDELQLSGTNRWVTEFTVFYFANFRPDGDESVQVRFYRNNFPLPGAPDKIAPGTMLYESDLFPMHVGYSKIELKNLNFFVPDDFTFTVEFRGVTMNLRDDAGLLLYHPPVVGRSYDDFWQRNKEGKWELLAYPGLKSNFAVMIVATPPPPATIKSISFTNGVPNVVAFSRPGKIYSLESCERLGPASNWRGTHSAVGAMAETVNLGDLPVAGGGSRFYRVVERTASISVSANHVKVASYAIPGKRYRLDATSDFVNWSPVAGPLSASGNTITMMVAKTAGQKQFYRIVEL